MAYDLDETRCDACGAPTPRLNPPAEIELCDRCFRADANAAEIAAMNEQTYLSAVLSGAAVVPRDGRSDGEAVMLFALSVVAFVCAFLIVFLVDA